MKKKNQTGKLGQRKRKFKGNKKDLCFWRRNKWLWFVPDEESDGYGLDMPEESK